MASLGHNEWIVPELHDRLNIIYLLISLDPTLFWILPKMRAYHKTAASPFLRHWRYQSCSKPSKCFWWSDFIVHLSLPLSSECKTVVSPLVMHLRFHSLAPSRKKTCQTSCPFQATITRCVPSMRRPFCTSNEHWNWTLTTCQPGPWSDTSMWRWRTLRPPSRPIDKLLVSSIREMRYTVKPLI